jgi:hypothetical protein
MAKKTETKKLNFEKRYLQNVPRKAIYWPLGILAVIALCIFLFVPHYKPVQVASQQEVLDAHRAIINRYFLPSTLCSNDNESKTERIKEFNQYFKVNQYANRAVIRGCNDADTLLVKDDNGKWQRTDVNIILSSRQNPEWQKACYIEDITVADSKVRPENGSIDANNLAICNSLAKESYIEVNLKSSIHFHL